MLAISQSRGPRRDVIFMTIYPLHSGSDCPFIGPKDVLSHAWLEITAQKLPENILVRFSLHDAHCSKVGFARIQSAI